MVAGSRLKRMVIGFGAGSSKLVARVQVYQALDWGRRRIAEATATGSKAPGMAVPGSRGSGGASRHFSRNQRRHEHR